MNDKFTHLSMAWHYEYEVEDIICSIFKIIDLN